MKFLRTLDIDIQSKNVYKYRTMISTWLHCRNATPDFPPDVSAEDREAMKGYSLKIEGHKTAPSGIYLNFTKFRTDLNFTKFRTDLNFTKFRTD